MCHFSRAYGALAALRLREARSIENKVFFHTARSGDWFVPMALSARLAFVHIGLGDLVGADRMGADAITVASAYHEFAALALGHTVRAAVAMLHGDLADADRHADRAATAARRCGHASAAYHLAPLRTALHLSQGRLDDAEIEASAWAGLPDASLAPLRAMVERRRGSMVSVPTRAPIRHITWLGAGVLAAQVTNALEAGDTSWLESALAQFKAIGETEIVFTASFPSSLPRLHADALCAVERYDEALDVYSRLLPVLREAKAYPDLVRALIGHSRAESRASGGSRDRARRSAAEALELSRRLDLAPLRAEAAALLRRDIDVHPAVRERQGEWRAILLTDIVGSTTVSQLMGDLAYHQLVMQHHELVRRCVAEHGGQEFSETGDGLFTSFPTTGQAVAAAFAIQDEATLAPTGGGGHRLGIKIALSGGEPLIRDDRLYGLIVNRASRIIELAKGGDIIADEAITDDLDPTRVEIRLGMPVELRSIGEHRPAWIRPREADIGTIASDPQLPAPI
jgi:class 3 adenylate cyclase